MSRIEFNDDDLDAVVIKMIETPAPQEPSPLVTKMQQIAGAGVGRKTAGIPRVPTDRTSALTRLPRVPQV